MAHRGGSSGSIARETPAAYSVEIGARGRIVLPAAVRDLLSLKENDCLVLKVEEDGSIRLRSRGASASELQGMLRPLSGGRSLVDGLLAERKREVTSERRAGRRRTGARRS